MLAGLKMKIRDKKSNFYRDLGPSDLKLWQDLIDRRKQLDVDKTEHKNKSKKTGFNE
tara:strand:- start:609 stop:779 length:171 start_codon:yes stop_codon:yes gene_type:complete